MHIDFSLPWHDPVLVFVVILAIILVIPLVLERIKIPSIIGFIVAGILVGEFGFNLIPRDSSIELFGTVGLLYLMFIAGLEIDLNEFVKNKSKGITFGIITILFPIIFGVPVFYFVFNYSFTASVLIGSILVSHTLVTYPIISKLGITKNQAVHIAIAGTLIADITALLILAIVTNNIGSEFEMLFWLEFIGKIILFGAVVLWGFPILSRIFLKYVSDNVLQYIYVLTVVFLSSFFAMLAGLEPIVGAFFAGLALNRLIPRTSPLMNRIDFIGNAIFIPFFLIGVGMLIDYHVLFQSVTVLIVALSMSVVAILSKYLAAKSTQHIFKLSKNEGQLIFGLSNARVASALVIALIGFNIILGQTESGENIRLLDEIIFNAVVIMILITSAISSFITQRAGRKIAAHDMEKQVIKETAPTENILIGLANKNTAENLIHLAISTIDKKHFHQIYGLHIITKSNENTLSLNRAYDLIDMSKKFAASADVDLKPILRYDINIAAGIINTIKEREIKHFFIGLHEKASLLDSFYGKMTSDLLSNSESTIYISKLYQPINTIKQYLIVLPPKAHLERGFCDWFTRISHIVMNTGNEMLIFGADETHEFLLNKMKITVNYKFKTLENYENKLLIADDIIQNTMIIFALARKNGVSHEPSMEKMPKFITKFFKENNFMIVYPNQIGPQKDEKYTYFC